MGVSHTSNRKEMHGNFNIKGVIAWGGLPAENWFILLVFSSLTGSSHDSLLGNPF